MCLLIHRDTVCQGHWHCEGPGERRGEGREGKEGGEGRGGEGRGIGPELVKSECWLTGWEAICLKLLMLSAETRPSGIFFPL